MSIESTHTLENGKQILTLASPCISSDTVGIQYVCVGVLRGHSNLALFCRVLVGPVDSAGALITSSLCPLKPPEKGTASEPPSTLMWPRSTTHVGHELT